MEISKTQIFELKRLAMAVRMASYQCGDIEHEDNQDKRPPENRGSTHELAVEARFRMEQVSKEFDEFVDSFTTR